MLSSWFLQYHDVKVNINIVCNNVGTCVLNLGGKNKDLATKLHWIILISACYYLELHSAIIV